MARTKDKSTAHDRARRGQSVAQGDTGEGNGGRAGMRASEQGISNRPGDKSRSRRGQSSRGRSGSSRNR